MKENMYRTYNCSELREKNVGEKIKLAGWVDTIRDLGGVLFIDLRDQYGITQVVVSGDEERVNFAAKIPVESTIKGTEKAYTSSLFNFLINSIPVVKLPH